MEVYSMRIILYLSIPILLFVGILSTQAAVKDDGLILYFSFDSENNKTIRDETGGGNDAKIIANANIAKDEKVYGGGSLEIRDANADVQVKSFNELSEYQDNSYLFWLNFIAAHNGAWSQIIAKKAPGSDRSPGIWICPNSLNIHWRFEPGNAGTGCAGPNGEGSLFELNKWYHLAGIKEGATLKFYIHDDKGVGKQVVADIGVPGNHTQGDGILYIGKTNYRAATFYIDDLYVYNRALDAKEISEVMDGVLLPVEAQDRLTTTWGKLKNQRD